MDQFIEICKEATYCMRTPQQDAAGWFLWLVWGLIVALVIGGLLGNRQSRRTLILVLQSPTEYRGRIGRETFLTAYYSLQALRAITFLSTLLAVALFGKTYAGLLCLLAGMVLIGWFSCALYCCVIRRGHDLNLAGSESFWAYMGRLFPRLACDTQVAHTWYILRTNKGNPFANRYGSAPEENNYLIPAEKEWDPHTPQFPSVWDEADWKNWKK